VTCAQATVRISKVSHRHLVEAIGFITIKVAGPALKVLTGNPGLLPQGNTVPRHDSFVALECPDLSLIQLYGTPYTDDMGPGKTFKQGYTGPDLLHFAYTEMPQLTFPGLLITVLKSIRWKLASSPTREARS
jgi:hypothetical protein